ncbi:MULTISPECIES: tubulin/FtsZ family protein [Haloferax]|jgi:cell division GTPase FtsZ|uniref:Tubulin-like protein CetZ1 n=6 Tax=Haloferax TaxID=2251 RepID=CETZ1_HALVD|nr:MULTISPECIES: tubulin/FtsZ family protein [Haloferax]D4GVD7.1 RecName: Full=Tubulin-like protein CetZ1; AltName: Full=Cell-structure-related euryarchaeota tubulin/FtsZ homolog 1 [Haloferax volcanii DS2]4B46_A Chain A, Cell Division Protein Ftsz [Haloferax volcanii]ADE04578.1 FtsZ family protein CetZ, type III [Haloferax volcanii DS2]ELK49319.1 cell division protein FtsZ [Haloferax sp. BAB-2207]ELY33433.1 cell division protein FtsZ [Haloferax volcanii DS2]ELZ75662.1 cell division protein Ft
MKLAMIGFGQAGGKVVDKFVEYDRERNAGIVRAAVAVNSAKADLLGLKNIPKDQRVLIGQSRVKGHGVGADNELGAEIAEEDIDEVQGAIDSIPVHEVDAFLVVSGLGGGTGSGGAPVLAKHLKRIYTEPVYGLGILPGSDEGGIYTLNAARSFQTFVREVDNLLVFDNDAWRKTGESVQGGYDEINEEIVNRFGVLFGAGEVQDGQEVAESVVDSSEIINTLAGGGVSTVGYASEGVEPRKNNGGGLLSRLTGGDEPDDNLDTAHTTNRITSLVRKAALGRLTLPCEIEGAERALLVLAGPPEHLNRKGIERGRKWIEEQTGSMEVRGGDYPIPGAEKVAGVILLSGVTNVPRIKELQQVAIEAQDNIEEIRQESDSNLETLINDDEDELESLF